MALTCGDRESPGEMMHLTAVVGNCVLFSVVVTGGLPQLCPSEIGERTAPRAYRTSGASGRRRVRLDPADQDRPCGVVRSDQRPWLTSLSRAEVPLRLASSGRTLRGMTVRSGRAAPCDMVRC